MMKALWRACKWPLRVVWKCFKWIFLLTLPLTVLPIICGISNGFYFAFWKHDQIDTHTDLWLHELKDLGNDWGVPGMTFRDFQDKHNDFDVLRLNSNDWAFKLGFTKPQEYGEEHFTNTPINKYGDLDSLMLDTRSSCGPSPPNEQWVYISDWGMPLFSEWDTAFVAAVQAGYVPSRLNKTRLFHAQCQGTAGFLCGVWGVRAPTLLHFLIEDTAPHPEDIEPGLTYSTALSNLRPVTVRVIEFPLQDVYTALPSTVFPGPTEQMLAMMRGDKLYEQFEPWIEIQQTMLRFQEYIQDLYDLKGTFLYYLGEVDEWMTDHIQKPLSLEVAAQIVYEITFLGSFVVVNSLVLGPWLWVKQLVLDFMGYPLRGDWILGDLEEKEWNPWDDLMSMPSTFGQLLGNAQEKMESDKSNSVGRIMTNSRPQATSGTTSSATK